jgi:CRISPR-associated protein Cas1
MEQLEIKLLDTNDFKTIPIEDVGIVILDNQQITITQASIAKLLENNVALITCNEKHHPTGMMLNLDGHTKQSKLFKHQLEASEPLKKQLWQQTIKTKIQNQASVLNKFGLQFSYLNALAKNVKSGDSTNQEAQAAAYYWKQLAPLLSNGNDTFKRERFGNSPNHLFNYEYAILRAIVARNLVGSGLLPTLGIFHRNQYNAFCLADDIMEPYRPYVDICVLQIIQNNEIGEDLNPDLKRQLLMIPVMDTMMGNEKRPLMVAAQHTTASLSSCFEGKIKKLKLPEMKK